MITDLHVGRNELESLKTLGFLKGGEGGVHLTDVTDGPEENSDLA